jgi:hypothetical protein
MNKEFKQYREKLLFDKQIVLLPETQVLVTRQIQEENLYSYKNNIIGELDFLFENLRITNSPDSQIDIINDIHETRKTIKTVDNMIRDHRNSARDTEASSSSTLLEERRIFVRQCPVNECKGYLSQALKCGLCDTNACKDCHEVKTENHTCKEEILQSIKMLKKDTKPCPKCGVMIMKIEGCDQMYCYPLSGGCGTAFSWRTLKIASGLIHNPHYYEYQRITKGYVDRNPMDHGGEREDFHCMEINHNTIHRMTLAFSVDDITILRRFTELREKYERDYTSDHIHKKNIVSRIDYMRNKVSDKQLKFIVQRRDKQEQREREIHDIFSMCVISLSDLLLRLLTFYDDKNVRKKIYYEIHTLNTYVNQSLLDISIAYGSKALRLW